MGLCKHPYFYTYLIIVLTLFTIIKDHMGAKWVTFNRLTHRSIKGISSPKLKDRVKQSTKRFSQGGIIFVPPPPTPLSVILNTHPVFRFNTYGDWSCNKCATFWLLSITEIKLPCQRSELFENMIIYSLNTPLQL